MQKEKERLLMQIDNLTASISKLPQEKLIYSRCNNHTKWFISNGSNPIYIPKKNRSFAKKLALQKYYSYQLDEYRLQLKLIETFLSRYNKSPKKSIVMLAESSYYRELLFDSFTLPSEVLNNWMYEQYQTNPKHPEYLIHKCLSNHFVRSKSEVIIANSLYLNKIPYRYECELHIGDITLYPDFTICHPITQEMYYWEHFGLMDQRSYRQNVASKIVLYGDHNIYPSINLITTYETAANPINSEQIEHLIREYFL